MLVMNLMGIIMEKIIMMEKVQLSAMISYVKTVDIMTARKLKSVSGVVRVEVDIQNLELLGHMESAENRKIVNLKKMMVVLLVTRWFQLTTLSSQEEMLSAVT